LGGVWTIIETWNCITLDIWTIAEKNDAVLTCVYGQ
jgi:hypothetical protein